MQILAPIETHKYFAERTHGMFVHLFETKKKYQFNQFLNFARPDWMHTYFIRYAILFLVLNNSVFFFFCHLCRHPCLRNCFRITDAQAATNVPDHNWERWIPTIEINMLYKFVHRQLNENWTIRWEQFRTSPGPNIDDGNTMCLSCEVWRVDELD